MNENKNCIFFSGFFMFMNSLKNLPIPKPLSEWCPGMYNLIDVFYVLLGIFKIPKCNALVFKDHERHRKTLFK